MSNPAPNGIVVTASRFSFTRTVTELGAAIEREGLALVASVDHGAAASSVGLDLRPTKVLIFGDPRAGTPLMRRLPTLALALPLKLLVWSDEAGRTWTAYEEPRVVGHRHGAGEDSEPLLAAMAAKLATLVGAIT